MQGSGIFCFKLKKILHSQQVPGVESVLSEMLAWAQRSLEIRTGTCSSKLKNMEKYSYSQVRREQHENFY